MSFSTSTIGPGTNQRPLAPPTPSCAPSHHAARCKEEENLNSTNYSTYKARQANWQAGTGEE